MSKKKQELSIRSSAAEYLTFVAATDREILQDAGKVTAEIAQAHAETEFEKYRIVQDRLYLSDFDKQIQALDNESDQEGGKA